VLNGMAIVMITAYKLSDEERADVMKTAGADLLLNKPLPTFGELKQLLEAAIAERHANPAAAADKPADADSATPADTPANPAAAAPASPNVTSTVPSPTNSTNKTNTNTNAAEPVRKEK
jgi:hypothetical protein